MDDSMYLLYDVLKKNKIFNTKLEYEISINEKRILVNEVVVTDVLPYILYGDTVTIDEKDYFFTPFGFWLTKEKSKTNIKELIQGLRHLVWLEDIPHPTCPEYVEHNESMKKILKYIDEKLLTIEFLDKIQV